MYLNNEERIKKEEAELEEMKKQARAAAGITDEESTEDQPSSEKPEAEPVQAESDTKQEEKPEAKAQEEDDSKLGAEEKNFKNWTYDWRISFDKSSKYSEWGSRGYRKRFFKVAGSLFPNENIRVRSELRIKKESHTDKVLD